MSSKTRFRQLGELVGRCVYEEGESPINRFDGGTGILQPDGTRFIAFGEDVLSASMNRGLVALGANTDYLYQLASAPEVIEVMVTQLYTSVHQGETTINLNQLLLREAHQLWKASGENVAVYSEGSVTVSGKDFAAAGVRRGDHIMCTGPAPSYVREYGIIGKVEGDTLTLVSPFTQVDGNCYFYSIMTPPWIGSPQLLTHNAEPVLSDDPDGSTITITLEQANGSSANNVQYTMITDIANNGIGRYYVDKTPGDPFEMYNVFPGQQVTLTGIQPPSWGGKLEGLYSAAYAEGDRLYLVPQDASKSSPLLQYPAESPPAIVGNRGSIYLRKPTGFHPTAYGVDGTTDLVMRLSEPMPSGLVGGEFNLLLQVLNFPTTLKNLNSLNTLGWGAAIRDTAVLRGGLTRRTLQEVYDGEYALNENRNVTGSYVNTHGGPVVLAGDPAIVSTVTGDPAPGVLHILEEGGSGGADREPALLQITHNQADWDDAAAAVRSVDIRGSGKFGPDDMYEEGLVIQPQLFLLRQNYAKSAASANNQFAKFSVISDPSYTSPAAGKGDIELVAGNELKLRSKGMLSISSGVEKLYVTAGSTLYLNGGNVSIGDPSVPVTLVTTYASGVVMTTVEGDNYTSEVVVTEDEVTVNVDDMGLFRVGVAADGGYTLEVTEDEVTVGGELRLAQNHGWVTKNLAEITGGSLAAGGTHEYNIPIANCTFSSFVHVTAYCNEDGTADIRVTKCLPAEGFMFVTVLNAASTPCNKQIQISYIINNPPPPPPPPAP